MGHTDVFVDNFIQLGQGGPVRMNALRCHLLHTVDDVLATPAPDEPHRNEAVSLKKLLKCTMRLARRFSISVLVNCVLI